MANRPFVRTVRRLALATLALPLMAWAAGTAFWMAPQANHTLDAQVTEQVGRRASVVVLRSSVDHPLPEYRLRAITARFKESTKAPVVAYGFSNRFPLRGRSESDILRGMNPGVPLAEVDEPGNGDIKFLDVGSPEVRGRLVEKYIAAKKDLGVDGFALDLSVRTPADRPALLARQCKKQKAFCPHYASGMDAVFADLRRALGPDAFIAYNGLFNNTPGQIDDQALLLKSADAVAIEFFGMDPKEHAHSFTRDILPYLQAIPKLPADRSTLVFGRGPWTYTGYLQDYEWQRYLYASFLLAARPNDMFKYHATFQVPTYKGRAGGMDYYADWNVDLGRAKAPAAQRDGLWVREFERGLVVVAPDDGRGGAVSLPKAMYTPEGETRSGRIHLVAGSSLILCVQPTPPRPADLRIDAETMARWNWRGTRLDRKGAQAVLELTTAPSDDLRGNHDVLLDYERSLTPYKRLEIGARLAAGASIRVVAEVDDRHRATDHAVVEIVAGGAAAEVRQDRAVYFRSPTPNSVGESWPFIRTADGTAGETVTLDGPKVFEAAGLRFRRWAHVRLEGPMTVTGLTLSRPMQPAELPGER